MKIIYLMGKSASGKDTMYQALLERKEFAFRPLVLATTRPMRSGEVNGRDYLFISEKQLEELRREGKVIEERVYRTALGPWHYLTVDSGQFAQGGLFLAIGTLESYRKLAEYFGEGVMVPIYLEVDDGLRLERALARERSLEKPLYEEMCRRFLADQEDFSEEKLKEAGIGRRFCNEDMKACLEEICGAIREAVG